MRCYASIVLLFCATLASVGEKSRVLIGATIDPVSTGTRYIYASSVANILDAALGYDKKTKQVTISKDKTSYSYTTSVTSNSVVPLRQVFEKFGCSIAATCTTHSHSCIIFPDDVHVEFDVILDDIIFKCIAIPKVWYDTYDNQYSLRATTSNKQLPVIDWKWNLIDNTTFKELYSDENSIYVVLHLTNNKGVTKTVNLYWTDSVYDLLEKNGWTFASSKQRADFQERQVTEIAKKHPQWKKAHIRKALQSIICIGMPKDLVVLSWGEPDEINRTVYRGGVHEQWIYEIEGTYVYIDNGVLSSWQD